MKNNTTTFPPVHPLSPVFQLATPEAVGIPSSAIQHFLQSLADADYCLHAFALLRGGKLCFSAAAAPYTLDTPHRVYSAGKSVLMLSLLQAVQEGKLALTDSIAPYFADILGQDHRFDSITVSDALTMRTGQVDDPFPVVLTDLNADLIRLFFTCPPVEQPGQTFRYNNTVPHIVYALTERATGIPFEAYQQEKLCLPLGVQVMAPTNSRGQYNPVVTAMSANALLAFAQLFLQEGNWQGKQLIEASLIRDAIACHTSTGLSGNGYGYQLWHNSFGGYRMDGGWGQYAIVLPQYDLAAVILSDMPDSSLALQSFESHLLPHLASGALPANTTAAHTLRRYGERLSLAPKAGSTSSALQARWLNKSYHFPAQALTLCLSQQQERLLLSLKHKDVEKRFVLGMNGTWAHNESHLLVIPEITVDNGVYCLDANECYFSATWRNANTLEITGKSLAEQGRYLYRLAFDANGLTFTLPAKVCRGGHTIEDALCWQSERGVCVHAAKDD